MTHHPITSAELATLKEFWSAEDERIGGRSDMSRCIAEMERLTEVLRKIGRDLEMLHPSADPQATIDHYVLQARYKARQAREAISPSQQ